MSIYAFESIIRTERTVKRYFTKLAWKNYHRFCTRCHSKKVYVLAGKRYRCRRCHYSFKEFTGRWLGRLNISLRNWLWIIKLFELELSARKIAKQTGVSYPTVLKAVHLLRAAIMVHYGNDEELLQGVKVCIRQGVHQWPRRFLVICQGTEHQIPRSIEGKISSLLERNGISLQP